jgi:hypothetical protein
VLFEPVGKPADVPSLEEFVETVDDFPLKIAHKEYVGQQD